MPEFGGSLTPRQIDQLAQYVAGLPRQDQMWASLRGDETEGRKVFFDPSTAYSCHRCHTFMGAGARVGPDLTTRVSRLSPREISQRILVVPHRETDSRYLTTVITLRDGTRVTGIKADESDDEIDLYDTRELPPTLVRFRKADIVSTSTLNGSPMPTDYVSRLSLKQLLDLVAFLYGGASSGEKTVTFSDLVL
jgi:putative heme-binding domain-containing protein